MNQPIAIGLLHLALASASWSLTPAEIIAKVEAKYASLDSLAIDSTITMELEKTNEKPSKHVTHCKLRLVRPKLYRIEWITPSDYRTADTGAVWSFGEKHYLSSAGEVTEYDRADDLPSVGISRGATATIPEIFFDRPLTLLRALSDPVLQPDENLGGVDCYVISGKYAGGTGTAWITKDFLLLQKQSIRTGKIPKLLLSDAEMNRFPHIAALMKKDAQADREGKGEMKSITTETIISMDLNPPLEKTIFENKAPLPSLPR